MVWGASRLAALSGALGVCLAVVSLGASASGEVASEFTHKAKPPPKGYHTMTVKQAGFSIAVPDGWRMLTTSSPGHLTARFDTLNQGDPTAPARVDAQLRQSGLKVKLFASLNSRDAALGSFGVVVVALDASLRGSLAARLDQLVAEYPGAPTAARIGKRPAVSAVSSIADFGADGSGGVAVKLYATVGYVVQSTKGTLLVAFISAGAGPGRNVQAMINSFRLLS